MIIHAKSNPQWQYLIKPMISFVNLGTNWKKSVAKGTQYTTNLGEATLPEWKFRDDAHLRSIHPLIITMLRRYETKKWMNNKQVGMQVLASLFLRSVIEKLHPWHKIPYDTKLVYCIPLICGIIGDFGAVWKESFQITCILCIEQPSHLRHIILFWR